MYMTTQGHIDFSFPGEIESKCLFGRCLIVNKFNFRHFKWSSVTGQTCSIHVLYIKCYAYVHGAKYMFSGRCVVGAANKVCDLQCSWPVVNDKLITPRMRKG